MFYMELFCSYRILGKFVGIAVRFFPYKTILTLKFLLPKMDTRTNHVSEYGPCSVFRMKSPKGMLNIPSFHDLLKELCLLKEASTISLNCIT